MFTWILLIHFYERVLLRDSTLSADHTPQLAGKLSIHKNTLSNYERGERVPDANVLVKLLEIFPEMNPEWLLTGKGTRVRVVRDEVPEGFFQVPFFELEVKGSKGGKY